MTMYPAKLVSEGKREERGRGRGGGGGEGKVNTVCEAVQKVLMEIDKNKLVLYYTRIHNSCLIFLIPYHHVSIPLQVPPLHNHIPCQEIGTGTGVCAHENQTVER